MENMKMESAKRRTLTPWGLVKRLVIRFIIFMAVWIVGCAANDYGFAIEARAYNMAYGWVIAAVALWLADTLQPDV